MAMKKELAQDAVTVEVHKALAEYAVANGIIHTFRALGEIICKGERTAENRLVEGGWTVDELRLLIVAFNNQRFNESIKQHLQL